MRFPVGIENNLEGRSLAWMLDQPGCYAYGESARAALSAVPRAISDYEMWINSRSNGESWLDARQIEINLENDWEVYSIDEAFDLVEVGYEVNSWFLHDWKPLTEQDVLRSQQLLSWTREDLMSAVSGLKPGKLQVKYAGERWNIEGILKHVGGAEWWYLDRLGMAMAREDLPTTPFERLEVVRDLFLETLPKLVGSKLVLGVDGEFWSPRKVLRRAVWHERDHTNHILKLRD